MGFDKVLFYGAFLWAIMYFLGWFLKVILPNTSHIITIILGMLVVYTFSKSILDEKNMFSVGFTWLIVNLILDFIFKVILLKNDSYFLSFDVFIFYIILLIEPLIVKKFSKNL